MQIQTYDELLREALIRVVENGDTVSINRKLVMYDGYDEKTGEEFYLVREECIDGRKEKSFMYSSDAVEFYLNGKWDS